MTAPVCHRCDKVIRGTPSRVGRYLYHARCLEQIEDENAGHDADERETEIRE